MWQIPFLTGLTLGCLEIIFIEQYKENYYKDIKKKLEYNYKLRSGKEL